MRPGWGALGGFSSPGSPGGLSREAGGGAFFVFWVFGLVF